MVILGIAFMVLSSLVQSFQFVAVETMLKPRSEPKGEGEDEEEPTPIHPYTACSLQGFWGSLIVSFLVLPISGILGYESWSDDLAMFSHSGSLLAIGILYMTVIGFSNIASTVIMLLLDSVYVTILSNSMPSTVWASELFIHYVISPSAGEKWSSASGWLHITSILLMAVGVAFYAGILSLPGWLRDEKETERQLREQREAQQEYDAEEGQGGYYEPAPEPQN